MGQSSFFADSLRMVIGGVPAFLAQVWSSCVVGSAPGHHRTRTDLAALTDRTFADIGLSRTVSLHA